MIKEEHIYVGIDLHKETHTANVVNLRENNNLIKKHLTIVEKFAASL